MLLSSLQLSSFYHWIFNPHSFFHHGFLPFQRIISNAIWCYEYISPKLKNTLQSLCCQNKTNKNLSAEAKPSPEPHLLQSGCLQTNEESHSTDAISFDSDTALVYLDTCATGSMSPFKTDFIPGTFTMNAEPNGVEGSGGSLGLHEYGTVRYTVTDDIGAMHVIEIPNTAYIPQLKYRLLAPQ